MIEQSLEKALKKKKPLAGFIAFLLGIGCTLIGEKTADPLKENLCKEVVDEAVDRAIKDN